MRGLFVQPAYEGTGTYAGLLSPYGDQNRNNNSCTVFFLLFRRNCLQSGKTLTKLIARLVVFPPPLRFENIWRQHRYISIPILSTTQAMCSPVFSLTKLPNRPPTSHTLPASLFPHPVLPTSLRLPFPAFIPPPLSPFTDSSCLP